jgi:TPR repeat protein
MRGEGVPKSMESMDQAERWFEAAAERGHQEAQYMAGRLNEEVQTTIRYSTLAAAQGDLRAQCELGKLIDKKGSLIQSEAPMERAIYWFEKAARRGHQESQYRLSKTLIALAEDRYCELVIPSFSPIPLSLYWAKQSTLNNNSHYNQGAKKDWVEFRNMLQDQVKGGCVACPSTRVRMHCLGCQAAY